MTVLPVGNPGALKQRETARARYSEAFELARGLRERGASLAVCAFALNEAGHRRQSGAPWDSGTVARLLRRG